MALYLMVRNQVAYWGSYMKSSPNGIEYNWVMRRKPMMMNRWYGNREQLFKVERLKGQYNEPLFHLTVGLPKGTCGTTLYANADSVWFISGPQITDISIYNKDPRQQSTDTLNCFFNRMKEYPHSYLIPMSKGIKLLKERYPVPAQPV